MFTPNVVRGPIVRSLDGEASADRAGQRNGARVNTPAATNHAAKVGAENASTYEQDALSSLEDAGLDDTEMTAAKIGPQQAGAATSARKAEKQGRCTRALAFQFECEQLIKDALAGDHISNEGAAELRALVQDLAESIKDPSHQRSTHWMGSHPRTGPAQDENVASGPQTGGVLDHLPSHRDEEDEGSQEASLIDTPPDNVSHEDDDSGEGGPSESRSSRKSSKMIPNSPTSTTSTEEESLKVEEVSRIPSEDDSDVGSSKPIDKKDSDGAGKHSPSKADSPELVVASDAERIANLALTIYTKADDAGKETVSGDLSTVEKYDPAKLPPLLKVPPAASKREFRANLDPTVLPEIPVEDV